MRQVLFLNPFHMLTLLILKKKTMKQAPIALIFINKDTEE